MYSSVKTCHLIYTLHIIKLIYEFINQFIKQQKVIMLFKKKLLFSLKTLTQSVFYVSVCRPSPVFQFCS